MTKAKKSKKQLDHEITHALQAKGRSTKKSIDRVVEDALFEFWASVASAYPAATTGDLTPAAIFPLKKAATAAVEEWVEYNVP
jgi:hypothetical protein